MRPHRSCHQKGYHECLGQSGYCSEWMRLGVALTHEFDPAAFGLRNGVSAAGHCRNLCKHEFVWLGSCFCKGSLLRYILLLGIRHGDIQFHSFLIRFRQVQTNGRAIWLVIIACRPAGPLRSGLPRGEGRACMYFLRIDSGLEFFARRTQVRTIAASFPIVRIWPWFPVEN